MAILTVIFFVQKSNPLIAGLLVAIPVKIVGTAFMANETGGKEHLMQAVSGMLIGQFVWGLILLGAYFWLKSTV